MITHVWTIYVAVFYIFIAAFMQQEQWVLPLSVHLPFVIYVSLCMLDWFGICPDVLLSELYCVSPFQVCLISMLVPFCWDILNFCLNCFCQICLSLCMRYWFNILPETILGGVVPCLSFSGSFYVYLLFAGVGA